MSLVYGHACAKSLTVLKRICFLVIRVNEHFRNISRNTFKAKLYFASEICYLCEIVYRNLISVNVRCPAVTREVYAALSYRPIVRYRRLSHPLIVLCSWVVFIECYVRGNLIASNVCSFIGSATSDIEYTDGSVKYLRGDYVLKSIHVGADGRIAREFYLIELKLSDSPAVFEGVNSVFKLIVFGIDKLKPCRCGIAACVCSGISRGFDKSYGSGNCAFLNRDVYVRVTVLIALVIPFNTEIVKVNDLLIYRNVNLRALGDLGACNGSGQLTAVLCRIGNERDAILCRGCAVKLFSVLIPLI